MLHYYEKTSYYFQTKCSCMNNVNIHLLLHHSNFPDSKISKNVQNPNLEPKVQIIYSGRSLF